MLPLGSLGGPGGLIGLETASDPASGLMFTEQIGLGRDSLDTDDRL